MAQLLTGKVCLITGAGAAKVAAREGARLVLVGRTEKTLAETCRDVINIGAEAICVVADVKRAEDCKRMTSAAVAEFGKLDCAINNAGFDGVQALTADYPEEVWDEVIAINLKGVWNCMRYEIPQMLKDGGGAIVNVSSAVTEPMQPCPAVRRRAEEIKASRFPRTRARLRGAGGRRRKPSAGIRARQMAD